MSSISTSYHSTLASYFTSKPLYLDEPTQKKPNTRKLVEQPWQQTKGEMWDEVTNTLCNLDFIQAKAAAKMTYDLVNDFNAALEVIPDNAENIRKEKERQARMDKYTQDLIACAKGEITVDKLEIPESIILWTEQQIDAEIERIKTRPTKADLLKDFLNFLGNESNTLQNHACEFAYFTHQQAWNFANEGPVGRAAEKLKPAAGKSLLRRRPPNRPPWKPLPQAVKTLSGHTQSVAVSITPDGKRAISSGGGTCILWDLETGQAVKTLSVRHPYPVTAVSITPDGKRAISSASMNNTCILWDLETGQVVKTLSGDFGVDVTSVSITPDGKRAISASEDKNCIIWDIETGQAVKTLSGHANKVTAVSITPDGKRAISASEDKTCIIWDLETGQAVKTLSGHTYVVNAVSITPDSKRAISASGNYCIIWDLETGQAVKTLSGHTRAVSALSMNRYSNRAISPWDLETGQAVKTLSGHTNKVNAVSITPDGKRAISASDDNTCILWDLETGQAVKTLSGHTIEVYAVSITPDGKRAISASGDKNCIIWDLETGQAVKMLSRHASGVNAVSITPDGKRAISASIDYTCIIWDLETGQAVKTLLGHTQWNFDLLSTLRRKMDFSDSIDRETGQTVDPFSAHIHKVNAVSVTPNGKRAISASGDKNCILWDLESGQAVKILSGHTIEVYAVSITPDGKRAISASGDKNCIIWDLETGQAVKTLAGHTSFVFAVSITPDGKRAISASADKTCIIWDLETGQAVKTLSGHTSDVKAVSITPDGKRAISASRKTCIIWDLETGQAIKKLSGHTAVSITPDGKTAIKASGNTCIIWNLETGEKLACFVTNAGIVSAAIFSKIIVLGCGSGEVVILKADKELINTGLPITTIRQIWDIEMQQYQPLSADCPLCGHRFEPTLKIIKTVLLIAQEAGLSSEQSPCLELPDEVWETPNLLGECPNCHEKLKFNPFFGSDIIEYYTLQEREREHERQYQKKFDDAENAFKEEKWGISYNLYLKLVHQGKFDANDLRYKMALCRLNSLTFNSPEIISDINILKQLLQEKGANDKAQMIADKLNERLDTIKQEELAKKKTAAPWWKKMFGN